MPNGRHHATSDHDFSSDETEFLSAMDAFKRATRKQFPTWTDALAVLRELGYSKSSQYEQRIADIWDCADECCAA